MGNSESSFEEQLQKKSSTINALHNETDISMTRIENEANRLIGLIMQRKYTQRDRDDRVQICQQLGWQKVDELAGLLPIQTLQGIRYKLGIIPPNTELLNQTKQSLCKDIVNFYLKKVNLISNIQAELPRCRTMEHAIYQGLTRRLKGEDLNSEEWIKVYNKLEKFNRDIKKRYALMERELERIRRATTMRELDAMAVTTNSILTKTNSLCKNYENELIRFSRRREVITGQLSGQQPLRPVPQEPTMTTVITSAPGRRVVRQITPVQRAPQKPLPGPPRARTVVQQPRTIVQQQQIIRRPIKPLPTKPIPIPQQLPVISIPQTPDVRKREVTIEGERIRREPTKIVVERPRKVETSLTVSPKFAQRVQESLRPGEKMVSIEPVVGRSGVPTEGIPARALANYSPRGPGQVPLVEGQAVIHITNRKGWAYVRLSNNKQGYVPLSFLSR